MPAIRTKLGKKSRVDIHKAKVFLGKSVRGEMVGEKRRTSCGGFLYPRRAGRGSFGRIWLVLEGP